MESTDVEDVLGKYRHTRECTGILLLAEIRLRRRGSTIHSSEYRSPRNIRTVDIFFPEEVDSKFDTDVGFRQLLHEFLSGCKCTLCEKHPGPGMKHISPRTTVLDELLGVPDPGTESLPIINNQGEGVSTESRTRRDTDIGSISSRQDKRILFTMLCYLGLPLFIFYPTLWENPVLNSQRGHVTYKLSEDLLLDHFKHLVPEKDALDATRCFIAAFRKAENQFYPVLKFSNSGGTVPGNAVLPFKRFDYLSKGGQGDIFSLQIPLDYRKYLDIDIPEPFSKHTEYVCKIISLQNDLSPLGHVGKAAFHELRGMQYMNTLQHPNLIKLLFWYDYLGTRHFVLPRYMGDLDQVLSGSPFLPPSTNTLPPVAATAHSFPTSSWLWQGMLGILDGLSCFHNVCPVLTDDQSQSSVAATNSKAMHMRRTRGTHLDLKPSNILISSIGEMVLSDCGTSRVKEEPLQLTTVSGEATEAYSPPWTEDLDEKKTRSNRSFDVWSMACILLEVVVYILGGSKGYHKFREDRAQETSRRGYAFWYLDSYCAEKFRLKKSVSNWLDKAERISREHTDDALFRITRQLRTMLKIKPDSRGSIADCISKLQLDKIRPMTHDILTDYIDQELVDTHLRLSGRVQELGYGSGVARPLSELHLTYNSGDSDGHPTRLKIFQDSGSDHDRDKLHLAIAYTFQGRVVVNIKEGSRSDERLIAHRLQPTGPNFEWSLLKMSAGCSFKSEDFQRFSHIQQALTGYAYFPGTYFLLKSCSIQPTDFIGIIKTPPIVVREASIEVWTEEPPQAVTGTIDRNQRQRQRQRPRALSITVAQSYSEQRSGGGSTRGSLFSWRGSVKTTSASLGSNKGFSSSVLSKGARLVIFRKLSDEKLDCIILKMDGGIFVIEEDQDDENSAYVCPNTHNKVRHKSVPYHQMNLGTQDNPLGLPVQVGFLRRMEKEEKLQHAKAIKLEFKSCKDLDSLRDAFERASFLEKYFRPRNY